MPKSASSADAATAIARHARKGMVTCLVTSLIALGCFAGAGVLAIGATSHEAEQVSATVDEEGTHTERRGGRRSKRWVEVRHVDVTVEDGTTGRVDSDDLEVGDRTEVWRDDDGDLSAEEPGISVNLMFFASVVGVVGLLFGAGAAGALRRARTLRRADVDAAPRVMFGLDQAALQSLAPTAGSGVRQIPLRVTESAHRRVKVDSTVQVIAVDADVPVDLSQGIPQWWEGRVLQVGVLWKVVALRSSPQHPWWVVVV